MSGPVSPFWNRGGGFGIQGSPGAGWTFTRTAIETPDTAETIATFGITTDLTGKLEIVNNTPTDALFLAEIKGTAAGSNIPLTLTGIITTDTGTGPGIRFNVATAAGAALTTRPYCDWRNNNSAILTLLALNTGANSALSWGTQTGAAPAFTTRSIGNRAIWYSNIGASDVDFATGVLGATTLWHSVARATNVFDHRWYGGATQIASLRGDGQLTTTGSKVDKVRIALTTPVTVAAGTDYIVMSNLTAAGAVAVNLPASPAAGLTYIIKDGKGDAGANNITITPAAGTIDGVATLVLAANYARAMLTYNGTEWNVIT